MYSQPTNTPTQPVLDVPVGKPLVVASAPVDVAILPVGDGFGLGASDALSFARSLEAKVTVAYAAEGDAAAAEAVLGDLEDALTVGLALLLLVDVELTADVDRVEDGLLAGEVTGLGDLADEDDVVAGVVMAVVNMPSGDIIMFDSDMASRKALTNDNDVRAMADAVLTDFRKSLRSAPASSP